ncbi:MAG TPA: putative lipid II flippase FtsW [Spirochaetota bacterium]|nr:putative lipid II flippase FtsW [Spirochaetota bacterium]HPN82225.1 putative lipid II flippase FtsW [Spirochaetota bacterium]
MGKPDMPLFVLSLVLILLGVLLVYSTSTTVGRRYYDNTDAFLVRQAIAAFLGMALLVGLIFVPHEKIRENTVPIVAGIFVLLVLVLIPGIGRVANNARRWIGFGPFQIQPSELAKLGVIIYLSMIMTKKRAQGVVAVLRGFMPPLIIIVLMTGLVYLEPDLSTALFILALGLVLFLMGGVPPGHVFGMILAAVPFGLVLVFSHEYMKSRLFAHLDPLTDASNKGYQIVQSLLSFQHGGAFGKGIGHGTQKMGPLPESHTDFVLAAQAEEIGAFGITLLLLLVLALVWRIFRVASRSTDDFSRLFCFGVAMMIGWQALVNAAMVTGLVPTTGLPFPFFSYGGSSLLMLSMALGIVLNISRSRTA